MLIVIDEYEMMANKAKVVFSCQFRYVGSANVKNSEEEDKNVEI